MDVDISLAALQFEIDAIERASVVDLGGVPTPIPTAEDLIIWKAVAHRLTDLADIAAILDMNPNADVTAIRRALAELEPLFEDPEILTKFDEAVGEWHRRQSSS